MMQDLSRQYHSKTDWPFTQRSFKLLISLSFWPEWWALNEAKAARLRCGTAAHLSPFCWCKSRHEALSKMFRTAKRGGWKTTCLTKLSVSGGFCRSQSCKVHWDRLEIADQDGCDKQNPKIWSFFVPRILKKDDVEYGSIGSPKISQNRVLPLCTMLIYIASGYNISHDTADSRVGK